MIRLGMRASSQSPAPRGAWPVRSIAICSDGTSHSLLPPVPSTTNTSFVAYGSIAATCGGALEHHSEQLRVRTLLDPGCARSARERRAQVFGQRISAEELARTRAPGVERRAGRPEPARHLQQVADGDGATRIVAPFADEMSDRKSVV